MRNCRRKGRAVSGQERVQELETGAWNMLQLLVELGYREVNLVLLERRGKEWRLGVSFLTSSGAQRVMEVERPPEQLHDVVARMESAGADKVAALYGS